MDTLPLELKEKIVGYLKKSDVQRLSAVSKEWNRLLEDIVWRKPKFTTKVSLSELVQYNRPIKILHSRSLLDFDRGFDAIGANFLTFITTLKRLVLNHDKHLRISEISFMCFLKCEIWITSSLLHSTLSATHENTSILMRRLIKLNSKIDSGHNWSEYFSLDMLSNIMINDKLDEHEEHFYPRFPSSKSLKFVCLKCFNRSRLDSELTQNCL